MTDIRQICSLSDEEFEARRAALERGLWSKVRERRTLENGVALGFEATPGIRSALEDFIAFEQGCCSSLRFAVRESGAGVELEIRGLDPESSFPVPVGGELESGPGSASPATPRAAGFWRRAIAAAGLGSVGALILCCVLPVAGVALFGAALAAPLTSLDNPWAISSTALALAGGSWLWRGRRDASRRAVTRIGAGASCSTDGGCGC